MQAGLSSNGCNRAGLTCFQRRIFRRHDVLIATVVYVERVKFVYVNDLVGQLGLDCMLTVSATSTFGPNDELKRCLVPVRDTVLRSTTVV